MPSLPPHDENLVAGLNCSGVQAIKKYIRLIVHRISLNALQQQRMHGQRHKFPARPAKGAMPAVLHSLT